MLIWHCLDISPQMDWDRLNAYWQRYDLHHDDELRRQATGMYFNESEMKSIKIASHHAFQSLHPFCSLW
jgi:hypothetical protein